LATSVLFSQDTVKNINDLYVDFSIPDNSAFKMLNIKDEDVSRPGNLKEFSIHFLNLVTSGSKISQGLAVEWAPLYTTTKSVKKYRELGIIRNISISFATEKSTNDTEGTDVALGLSIIPIDKSDPLTDTVLENSVNSLLSKNPAKYDHLILEELQKHLSKHYDENAYANLVSNLSVFRFKDNQDKIESKKIIESFENDLRKASQTIDTEDKAWLEQFIQFKFTEIIEIVRSNYSDETMSKQLKVMLNDFKKRTWNSRVLQFNGGIVFSSNNSTWKKLTPNRFVGCVSYSDGFSSWGQFVINAQGFWSANDVNWLSNKYSIGARFLAGNSDVRGSVEFIYSTVKGKNILEKEDKLKAALGFEIKISEGIWLETAVGVDNVISDFDKSDIISLANFKYTFKKKSRYSNE
jgi:hypothetical protein